MKFYPLYSAAAHMYDFEGLDLKPDEFEIYAYRALEIIGNYWGETVTEVFKIENFIIPLPEECEYIEQVTRTGEDYLMTDNIYRENYSKSEIENYVESRKRKKPILYQKGGFISYEQIGNSLRFKETGIPVLIMYRRRLLDEDGHPMITRDEAEAISAFCLFAYNKRKLNQTKDRIVAELLPMYKQTWDTKCSSARVHEYINQNDIDELSNALTSWDRKVHNISKKNIM